MKFPGLYFLGIGFLMIAQWAFFIAAGAVPELQTEPIRIAFHLVAEFVTALSLIFAGAALLRRRPWAKAAGLFAAGALAYTALVSPGYFAQQGQWPLVIMFAVILALDAASIAALFRGSRPQPAELRQVPSR